MSVDRYPFVGASRPMKLMYDRLFLAALSPAPVMIMGEVGTGKEMAARAIHQRNNNSAKAPFTALQGGAVTPEILERYLRGIDQPVPRFGLGVDNAPSTGTVFIDEFSELSPVAQGVLLRYLKDQDHGQGGSVRLMVSTRLDQESLVTNGMVRPDLVYWLQSIVITVPPLRMRMDDFPELCTFFLDQAAKLEQKPFKTIAPDAMKAMQDYDWPGNAQQLRAAIRRMVVFHSAPTITKTMVMDTLFPLPPDRVLPRWFDDRFGSNLANNQNLATQGR
jgi:DNA-binding NtrC family response regulator